MQQESGSTTSIGFRCTPTQVHYAIVGGSSSRPEVIKTGPLKMPAAFDWPDSLKWMRSQVLSVVGEFHVGAAGVRTTEPLAGALGGKNRASYGQRCQVEGVVIEACAASGLKTFTGPNATISGLLESDSAKAYVDGDKIFRGIKSWGQMSRNFQDATLAAVAALVLLER